MWIFTESGKYTFKSGYKVENQYLDRAYQDPVSSSLKN